jgi:hypothetical protein
MARKERALQIQIPTAAEERPAWSRVGLIGAAGFVIGVVWPRFAGVTLGPDVPEDARPKASAEVAVAPPSSAPAPSASAAAPPPAAPAEPAAPAPHSEQRVTIGSGKITRCSDDKGKKAGECGELLFDPLAMPKLEELAKCPAAMGLDGKLAIGFEIDFKKKEVQIVKGKKTSLPSATVNGVLQCAARDFSKIDLDTIPHSFRKYTIFYTATFFPPGKGPDEAAPAPDGGDGEQAAGSTTSELAASGVATIAWDTALVRKQPKDGDVVARLVRGTRVKIVGKQSDWYKIESGTKSGWLYRGAIGL